MREASLVDLARRHPTRERDLYTIRDLKPGERRRYGAKILGMIERVRKLHESELPPRPARRPRVPRQKEVIRALQKEAAKIAVETVRACLEKPTSVEIVRFVCFSEEDLAVYRRSLEPG